MSDLINLGIITGDLNQTRTGIGTYIYHLINELKSKYDITLIRHEGGMDIPGCDSLIIKNLIKKRYNSLLWNQSLKWHEREIKNQDIIHNPGQFLSSPIKGLPSVITIHDITPVLFPQYHFPFRTWSNRIFLPSVLERSSLIIADSQNTKKDICSRYRVEPEKIRVIPLAADSRYYPRSSNEIEEWQKKFGLNNPYLLFVGTIEPRKNIHTLLHAFSLVADKFPDLLLILTGADGWNSKPIFDEIRASKFSHRIRHIQYIPHHELPFLYNGAVALLYPSWYEGYGLPPLEAMQCGTPVISSNTSSLPEVLGPGGILIDPGNFQGFADAIIRIITDELFRKEMVQYGLERSRRFSWKKTAKQTAEVYDILMHR